jgi:hypothetical protein
MTARPEKLPAPWIDIASLASNAPLPDGYRYERLMHADIADVVRSLAHWYPGIAVGTASRHLDPRFYDDEVALDGAPERDFFVVLLRKKRELAGMLSVERERDSEVLYGRVGAVSPEHRGLNLGERFPVLMETMGRGMGLSMLYSLVTLEVPTLQASFERQGWQLIGIFPGFDKEMVEPGVTKRVYEAIYAKVLVDEDAFVRPRYAGMTPRTAALFERLFPGKAERV